MDFIYDSYRKLSCEDFGLLCTIVWRTWFIRNSLLFHSKRPDFLCSIGWCKSFLFDFNSRNDKNTLPSCSSVPMGFTWSPPILDRFKVKCRAVTNLVSRRTGLGIIIRNRGGIVLSSCSLFLDSGMDFLSANAVAILKGVQFGKYCGLLPFCVESDASNVVNLINLRNHANSRCGNIEWCGGDGGMVGGFCLMGSKVVLGLVLVMGGEGFGGFGELVVVGV
ncbi:hypothetical protein EZV62_016162 [Acer yangbiense]|uniref:RNase H type-1 domain-containing protein n=1 Tax=Acer yangbiense TaxID=1000413 RepID=A0A5C7HMS9_9ROSI|nr:hypothetical protein EZV62_016162 [Acer yangbiense]